LFSDIVRRLLNSNRTEDKLVVVESYVGDTAKHDDGSPMPTRDLIGGGKAFAFDAVKKWTTTEARKHASLDSYPRMFD
jgi:hypothetical protein